MNSIKLALLNKLERDVNEAKEIKTAVNGTDDIFIYFSGNRISLDHAVLEYARDYYDKEYKYGDINKSIYEVCFYILQHGRFANDFYIISDDSLFEFFSYYIIDNQWGIGRLLTASPPNEKYSLSEQED